MYTRKDLFAGIAEFKADCLNSRTLIEPVFTVFVLQFLWPVQIDTQSRFIYTDIYAFIVQADPTGFNINVFIFHINSYKGFFRFNTDMLFILRLDHWADIPDNGQDIERSQVSGQYSYFRCRSNSKNSECVNEQ